MNERRLPPKGTTAVGTSNEAANLTAPTCSLVHVAPWVTTGGGIESVLRWHREQDPVHGLQTSQLALFDRVADAPAEARASLRVGWKDTLWNMRRKFAGALARHLGATVIYHNAWGLPLFADLDGATRRLAYLHGHPNYVAEFLPALRGWLDGAVTVTPASVTQLADDPATADSRCLLIAAPVVAGGRSEPTRPVRHPLVIGYAGRLERMHKRVDRLPPLLRALDRAGCAVRLEILGDGSARKWLERELRGRAVFHGWRTGEAYWRVLHQWDAIVFLSDSEGGPMAMVEAMAAGVIPFFPQLHGSLGDLYAPQIDASCHYPAGELDLLAAALKRLAQADATAVSARRARAQAIAGRHTPQAFGAAFAGFVRSIAASPRVSRAPNRRRRMGLADLLPLGLVTRLFPGELWR